MLRPLSPGSARAGETGAPQARGPPVAGFAGADFAVGGALGAGAEPPPRAPVRSQAPLQLVEALQQIAERHHRLRRA